MRQRSVIIAGLAICLACSSTTLAHLCNDVFIQARDNLAVKVDIRDGQLRIGKDASFRVYLLNTMDRNIDNIGLEVLSDHFRSAAKPSHDWRTFPVLKAKRRGGKKEYFTVTLNRKPGVPDGKYKIDLRLINGRNSSQRFKTVDLETAVGVCELPAAGNIRIDGKADQAEWGNAYLCSDFYEYAKSGRYFENRPARDQARVRMAYDRDNLYCLFKFQGGAGAKMDAASLYIAPSTDDKPVQVAIDRLTGKVHCDTGTAGIVVRTLAAEGIIECKIPRGLLRVKEARSFYVNFTRTVAVGKKKVTSYWRGNKYSALDPIVYGQFTIAE